MICSDHSFLEKMKEVVLKLDIHDDKCKKKVMTRVSGLEGVESMDMNAKDSKFTVTGDVDPVEVATKLRKICHTEILSVGPAKSPIKPIKSWWGPKRKR